MARDGVVGKCRRTRYGWGVWWGLLLAVLAACDSGGTECECPAAGLTVNVPLPLAREVTAITPSDLACTGATIDPDPSTVHNAKVFHVTPTQAGPCQIEIFFSDGTTFSDQLTVVETTGCCAGLRTSPLGAAEIDVPPPEDAGAEDAGGEDGGE